MGFETDLPALEPLSQCALDGTGCTLIPLTDEGVPAAFYPFFSTGDIRGQCYWAIGNDIRGFTHNDFGRNNQYGNVLLKDFQIPGGIISIAEDFRQILNHNPCQADDRD